MWHGIKWAPSAPSKASPRGALPPLIPCSKCQSWDPWKVGLCGQDLGAGKDRAPCPALSPPGEGAIRRKQCNPASQEQGAAQTHSVVSTSANPATEQRERLDLLSIKPFSCSMHVNPSMQAAAQGRAGASRGCVEMGLGWSCCILGLGCPAPAGNVCQVSGVGFSPRSGSCRLKMALQHLSNPELREPGWQQGHPAVEQGWLLGQSWARFARKGKAGEGCG